MMVLQGQVTDTIPANTAYTDTFHGDVGQTDFEMQGDAAQAARQGATITATATIGGTDVASADIQVFTNTNTVFIRGLVVPARTRTQTGTVEAGVTRIPITELNILTAIDGGVNISVDRATFTPTGGSSASLNPLPRIDTDTEEFIINANQNTGGGSYSISIDIPQFTTSGIPRTRRFDSGRVVVVTYNIREYHQDAHRMYPADRCTWEQEPSNDGNGYHIYHAAFYTGATSGNSPVTVVINNPVLGYIGKSGRFVAITDTR